jgi:phosphatidylglycerophosphatase A
MKTWRERLAWLLATCGGFGYSPIMPGTAGAIWGVAIYVPIALFAPEPLQTALIVLALLASCVVTVALAPWAEQHFGAKDSKHFVTDEVAGLLLTVLLFRVPGQVLLTSLWTFVFSRLCDIVKIPPSRSLEHLPRGWGVLADDLMASIYAAGYLHALYYFFPHWFGG